MNHDEYLTWEIEPCNGEMHIFLNQISGKSRISDEQIVRLVDRDRNRVFKVRVSLNDLVGYLTDVKNGTWPIALEARLDSARAALGDSHKEYKSIVAWQSDELRRQYHELRSLHDCIKGLRAGLAGAEDNRGIAEQHAKMRDKANTVLRDRIRELERSKLP